MHNRFKKLWIAVLCLLVSVCLSACVKAEFEITIKENGKADVSILYAFSDALAQYGDTDSMMMSEEEAEEYRLDGWTVEDYSADGFTGNLVYKKDMDLTNTSLGEGTNFSVVKEGSTYTVDAKLLDEETASSVQESAGMIASMGGSFKVKLNLPVEPIEHNATSVSSDGKSLEWDLLQMDTSEPIHVKFRMSNPLIPIIIALVAVLAIAAAALIVLGRKKKAGQAQEAVFEGSFGENPEAPEAPAGVYAPGVPAAPVSADAMPAASVSSDAMPAASAMPAATVPVAGMVAPAAAMTPTDAPAPGAPVPASAMPRRICARCGAELENGAFFCSNCGERYVAPDENQGAMNG